MNLKGYAAAPSSLKKCTFLYCILPRGVKHFTPADKKGEYFWDRVSYTAAAAKQNWYEGILSKYHSYIKAPLFMLHR